MMKKLIIYFLVLGIGLPLVYSFTKGEARKSKAEINTDESIAITGEELFQKNCIACHGIDRKGNPPAFPSLISIAERMNKDQVTELLQTGRNSMPSFSHLSEPEREALTGFLFGEQTNVEVATYISPINKGGALFVANCARCHKVKPDDPQPPDQKSWGMKPAILGGIALKYGLEDFNNIVNSGPCYMPSFENLQIEDKEAIYAYLNSIERNLEFNPQMVSESGCRNNNSKGCCSR